jgi:peptidyl-prolyl cis-trans isomerase C
MFSFLFRAMPAATAAVGLAVLSLAMAHPASAVELAQTTPDKPATSAPAAEKPAAKPPSDPVVATVNGAQIHLTDVVAAQQDLPAQYQQYPIQVVYPALLERLIDGKLIAAAGKKAGLAKDPEVKQRMAQIEEQVIQSVYLERVVKAKLTDAILKKEYDAYLKANPPEPEVHARHIVVKTEDEAKDIIKQLKGGADFATLAKSKSAGPSAAKGGDLGFIKKGDVVDEFAAAAFALKPGQYTDAPVKTEFGWHVIKVEDTRMSTPPAFDQVKPELERAASQEMVSEVMGDLRKGAKIARFKPDGTPMPEGDEAPAGANPTNGK